MSEVHLRPRPGNDAALMAGLIRMLLETRGYDEAFCADNVQGVDELRRAVGPFDPVTVERHTGVTPDELRATVDVLRSSRRGAVTAGTGANMTPDGTLAESLILALPHLVRVLAARR